MYFIENIMYQNELLKIKLIINKNSMHVCILLKLNTIYWGYEIEIKLIYRRIGL